MSEAATVGGCWGRWWMAWVFQSRVREPPISSPLHVHLKLMDGVHVSLSIPIPPYPHAPIPP
jgi:hypothetical protein